MICKIATITHSKNALEYCENGGELIHANGVNGNAKEINKQFEQVHALKENIKHKSLHAIISFNPEDKELNKGQMMEISEQYAKQHGFYKNQYAVYLHQDKKHTHLHIVANRIGIDRKVVSSSHSYPKNTAFSKDMEKEYNLIQTNRKTKGKDFKTDKYFARTMKEMLDTTLKYSKSLEELGKNLKEQYSVTMHKGRGVSFMYQEGNSKAVKVKGSEVGREYSLKGLESQIQNLHFPKDIQLSEKFIKFAKESMEENNKEINISVERTNVVQEVEHNVGRLLRGTSSDEEEFTPRKKRKKTNYGSERSQGGGMNP